MNQDDDFSRLIRNMSGPGVTRPAQRKLEAIPVVIEGPTGAMCAATMCPLFAPDGSPWTGNYRSACEGPACGFFDQPTGKCDGGNGARYEVDQIAVTKRPQLQLAGVVHGQRTTEYVDRDAREFDCPYSGVCQWQKDAGEGQLCPPRHALSLGVDPRACAY